MKTLMIELNQIIYPVYIGTNILDIITHHLDRRHTLLIITDQTVKDGHIDKLKAALQSYEILIYTLGHLPEEDKNIHAYQSLMDFAVEHQLDRKISVLAFGGGAVGDFAGFFTATYKRGVDLYHLPTTILAHDSSIGGKVALNHNYIKNIIGAFYQPKAVVYDLQFIKTLNNREILSGLAEVIKHDLLNEGKLLETLTDIDQLIKDPICLTDVLLDAIQTKYHYIKDDLYEKNGIRQFLNLGHTLGHAVEVTTPYSHGEAVLLGICFDIFLSDPMWAMRLFQQFTQWGYFRVRHIFNQEEIVWAMKNDKKNEENFIKFIGLIEIGKPSEILLTSDQFLTQFQLFLKECKW